MEPIPETVRAIEELGPFADGGEPARTARGEGPRISALVPDCIALTLVSSEHAVTFALLASRRQLGLLAALQGEAEAAARPAPDGPERDRRRGRRTCWTRRTWHRHALSDAAPCVATTLTLPVRGPGPLAG